MTPILVKYKISINLLHGFDIPTMKRQSSNDEIVFRACAKHFLILVMLYVSNEDEKKPYKR